MVSRLVEWTGQCQAIDVAVAVSVRIEIIAHRIDRISLVNGTVAVIVNKITDLSQTRMGIGL